MEEGSRKEGRKGEKEKGRKGENEAGRQADRVGGKEVGEEGKKEGKDKREQKGERKKGTRERKCGERRSKWSSGQHGVGHLKNQKCFQGEAKRTLGISGRARTISPVVSISFHPVWPSLLPPRP